MYLIILEPNDVGADFITVFLNLIDSVNICLDNTNPNCPGSSHEPCDEVMQSSDTQKMNIFWKKRAAWICEKAGMMMLVKMEKMRYFIQLKERI
mgnify:CR=1 FL=1